MRGPERDWGHGGHKGHLGGLYKRPRRTLFVLKNSAQMRGEREEKGPGVNVEQCLVRKGLSEGGRGNWVPFERGKACKVLEEGATKF